MTHHFIHASFSNNEIFDRNRFHSLSQSGIDAKSKKKKLDPAYKLLREICTKHTAPFHMALGQLGARYYHKTKTNPELETLFKVIATGDNEGGHSDTGQYYYFG